MTKRRSLSRVHAAILDIFSCVTADEDGYCTLWSVDPFDVTFRTHGSGWYWSSINGDAHAYGIGHREDLFPGDTGKASEFKVLLNDDKERGKE